MKFSCYCPKEKDHGERKNWVVIRDHWSASAFNGYKKVFSEYSIVQCKKCMMVWRTKAKYVDELPKESEND